MPFGLCNAPATFERFMEKILQNKLMKICLVYLDDIIIFGKTFSEIINNLRNVFLRLREARLKVNPKKCNLLDTKVKYLGHVVSEEGITTDPEKISAVKNWPTPKSKKQIRNFLGFCSYYRTFVKGFSFLTKPLYNLTEDNVKFSWDESCQDAFEILKHELIFSPILFFPLERGEFILDTDQKFLIRTDHTSLRWLMSFRDLEGQLARWLERLQQYDFEIIYRKGKVHKNTDGLSRRPCEKNSCTYCTKIETKKEN